jgi:SAM-dependent methyltransferase
MKIKVVAENPIEQIVLALGMAPVTLMDTHMSMLRARAIMVGTKLGIFDAVANGAHTVEAIAAACGTHQYATGKLLGALTGSGYLHHAGGRYDLTPVSRKWVVSTSPDSLRDKILFEFVEWEVIARTEEYLRSGRPLELHESAGPEIWSIYQRAMRALSTLAAPEVVRRMPGLERAARMLDIGGSHGFYSVSFCRKYPALEAVVLDLPAAVEYAAPILAAEKMGDRVTHRPGNALTDDLGTEAWDFVFTSQLVHHFDEAANRELAGRVARALKPGGMFAILELLRPASPDKAGQLGALLDLYFALTSESGTWSADEMTSWQRDAGLVPQKPIFLRTMPGGAAIVAKRKR